MAGESLLARLGEAARLLIGGARSVPAGRWLWPGSGGPWGGNGDRGPPGSWQRNLNGPHSGIDLLAFSAVYACVNVIASDCAKLPIQVFAVDLESGAREPRRSDYYAALFREPNDYQTHADFMLGFVQSYLLQGNTFAYCGDRNRRGEIQSMHVLNPYRVTPLIAEDGSIFYRCGEDFLAGLKPDTVVPERDMIHHRLPLLPGYPLMGVTPIFAAAASSAVGVKILQDSQQFFANSSRPSGVLSTEQRVGDDVKDRTKQEWDSAFRGSEYGKTAMLSHGLKWEPITITAQDAQLIEQLRWSVEDVARVFRVPTFMLGDVSKVTYRNSEQLARAYLTGCLAYHIEALEERFERAFQFPNTFELKFDLTQLLRTEIDVRFTAYGQALQAGWQSINEVRAQEGLKPVAGGEEPRVQVQYLPLTAVDGVTPATPATPPLPEPAVPAQESVDPVRVRRLVREKLRRAAP